LRQKQRLRKDGAPGIAFQFAFDFRFLWTVSVLKNFRKTCKSFVEDCKFREGGGSQTSRLLRQEKSGMQACRISLFLICFYCAPAAGNNMQNAAENSAFEITSLGTK
jgi:hypothetical protein